MLPLQEGAMIVSQLAWSAVGPFSTGTHTVLFTNLEAVPLTLSIEFALNQIENPWLDQSAVTGLLKSAFYATLHDAGGPLTWKRSGDLHRTGVRRTVPAMRSGAVMLTQIAVSPMGAGLYLLGGTVDVTLPVMPGGSAAAPKPVAQLDHPARVLVTVFHRVGYRPSSAAVDPIWPMHPQSPMPPVGGSCEFLLEPQQPASAPRSRRSRTSTS
jgi:hypothetical protein